MLPALVPPPVVRAVRACRRCQGGLACLASARDRGAGGRSGLGDRWHMSASHAVFGVLDAHQAEQARLLPLNRGAPPSKQIHIQRD
ncbi:MAG: hypothetical protein ACYDHX_10090 [Methanothrix sp.]